MKTRIALLLLVLLLLPGVVWAASAAIPGVPNNAQVRPVDHFDRQALWYIWAEKGEIYTYFKAISNSFYVCGASFEIHQNKNVFTGLTVETLDGFPFCDHLVGDRVFVLKGHRLEAFDPFQPFTVVFNANVNYTLNIDSQSVAPGTVLEANDFRPVYRFFYMPGGSHFFTIHESEKDEVIEKYGDLFRYEGIGFYALPRSYFLK